MHKMRGTKIYINFQSKDEYENNLEKKIIYLTNLGGNKKYNSIFSSHYRDIVFTFLVNNIQTVTFQTM